MRLIDLSTRGGYIAKAVARARAKEAARTGLHVSTIVNDMLQRMDPSRYNREIAEGARLAYQETGNVIEDIIAVALARRLPGWAKPDPREFRGVIGSPDGWQDTARAIHEIKATWVSEKKFFDGIGADGTFDILDISLKLYGYLLQALFYALAWDADRIYFHVLFIVGTFGVPSSRTFVIKFSRAELEANYRRLAQHALDVNLPDAEGVRPYLKAA